ncbi:hypothetical protein ISG33_02625 [Glaciecola sp. MH2013]|uniref:hypothetical protein n=1 Tax=Glaciecola sp. MH2013 TaxID=2785524 RepID=UPI00189D09BE|nr:hypothetical protein [Glaciecola sp. MH2013]MBF7072297.1 hypothetical protein [Glaciecola sp. MH2013]
MRNFVLSMKESLLRAVPIGAAYDNNQAIQRQYETVRTPFIIDNREQVVTEVLLGEPIIMNNDTRSSLPEITVLLKYLGHIKAGDVVAAAELNSPKEIALERLQQFIDRFDLMVLKGTGKKAFDGKSQIISLFRDGSKSLLLVKKANNYVTGHFFCDNDGDCKLVSNHENYDLTLLEKVKTLLD